MEGVVPCHSLLGLGAERHLPHVLREVVHHALAVPLRRVEVKDQVNLHRNKKYTQHISAFFNSDKGHAVRTYEKDLHVQTLLCEISPIISCPSAPDGRTTVPIEFPGALRSRNVRGRVSYLHYKS